MLGACTNKLYKFKLLLSLTIRVKASYQLLGTCTNTKVTLLLGLTIRVRVPCQLLGTSIKIFLIKNIKEKKKEKKKLLKKQQLLRSNF